MAMVTFVLPAAIMDSESSPHLWLVGTLGYVTPGISYHIPNSPKLPVTITTFFNGKLPPLNFKLTLHLLLGQTLSNYNRLHCVKPLMQFIDYLSLLFVRHYQTFSKHCNVL